MRFIPKTYNLFDDMFDDFFKNSLFSGTKSLGLKTDIVEKEDSYQLQIEVPGFKKEDIKVNLKDGYLTINAKTDSKTEEKDTEGNIIRRERYSGSMSRSYYLGDNVKPEDISANCADGILKVNVMKKEEPETEETSESIEIG